eukprot:1157433-Pelagomonas_calceolata.AAC.9
MNTALCCLRAQREQHVEAWRSLTAAQEGKMKHVKARMLLTAAQEDTMEHSEAYGENSLLHSVARQSKDAAHCCTGGHNGAQWTFFCYAIIKIQQQTVALHLWTGRDCTHDWAITQSKRPSTHEWAREQSSVPPQHKHPDSYSIIIGNATSFSPWTRSARG